MNNIWLTSDTHFSSERTLQYSRRPFKTVQEMDETLISNWNELVKNGDTIYHLGDFGDFTKSWDLKGRIVLLMGNYDRSVSPEKLREYNFCMVISNMSFRQEFNGDRFVLCHEPIFHSKKYFTLFGHIHQLQMVKRYGLNVGTDCHFFKPIDMDVVKFYKKAIEEHYDENVFEG